MDKAARDRSDDESAEPVGESWVSGWGGSVGSQVSYTVSQDPRGGVGLQRNGQLCILC